MIGQTLGKYRVIDRIGRGGMGTVYRAVDDTLHRDVAIKVLNAELHDPEVARRFRAEAITVARLNHPGIATVYELFEHENQWLMVMEFVRGETVEAVLEKSGALSAERAAEVCLHALAALAHAHHLGVVHRDLKPANLMITESGVVKVMDFGIARVSGTEHLTSGGYTMGTPAYMSPEQVLGQPIDARADVYALGVVFYRLVTGALPFTGASPFALAQSQVNDPPTPVGFVRADLPGWVDQIISRALAKNPEERFQSAAAFHDALSRCLSGREPTLTYDPTAPTEMMVTPPFALQTGTLRPSTGSVTVPAGGDTVPIKPGESPTAKSAPGSSTYFTRSNQIVMLAAGAIVALTMGVAWFWNQSRRVTETTSPDPAAPQTSQLPPAPSPAPAPAAATPANPKSRAGTARSSAASEIHVFPGLLWLTPNEDPKASALETPVALTFASGNLTVAPATGGKALQTLPLSSIKKATFVHSADPAFDPSLPGPPAQTKYPNSRQKDWLVLQNDKTFMIVRLDKATQQILDAFENLSGKKVVHVAPPK